KDPAYEVRKDSRVQKDPAYEVPHQPHDISCSRYGLSGSFGSSEGDRTPAERCKIAYVDGNTISVAHVAAASPPMTARARGAGASAPSPRASAMGTIPAIIAALVIRTGRILAPAASMSGCS